MYVKGTSISNPPVITNPLAEGSPATQVCLRLSCLGPFVLIIDWRALLALLCVNSATSYAFTISLDFVCLACSTTFLLR